MHLSDRVLVIGAGPAGSSCALKLRQCGVEVDLVEQAVFPRTKVCGSCLGGRGISALAALGLADSIQQLGVPIERWQGSIGGRQVKVDLPVGLAISRARLDDRLRDAAEDAGANLIEPCTATVERVEQSGVRVRLEQGGDRRSRDYPCVVVATGLKATGLSSFLPWVNAPAGPFGVGYIAEPDPHCERGVIYMACHDDGYVGIVQLEDGRSDIAAALNSGARRAAYGRPQQRIARILAESCLPPIAAEPSSRVMTTPPLRRRRLAGRGRLIAIGDAAGYVEPFTGEGITWALQSGVAAGELIGANSSAWLTIGEQWRQIYADQIGSRKWLCWIVTSALQSGAARAVMGQTLARWPGLALPLVRQLNGSQRLA